MPKRPPQDDEEPSAEEKLAAVTKDFEESGLSFNEYFFPGAPEPREDERPQLTPLEWMQAPELIADRKRLLEIAKEAIALAESSGEHAESRLHRIYEGVIKQFLEAHREKRRQDSARGGRARPKKCPGAFAFLRRRVAEIVASGDRPHFDDLLGELPCSDSIFAMHLEQHGPENSVETHIFRDPGSGQIVENQYKLIAGEQVMTELERIEESTFRGYFTDAKAAII